jgi:hypothetical protein
MSESKQMILDQLSLTRQASPEKVVGQQDFHKAFKLRGL